MRAFLEVSCALGARRGEVLALRWSDIVDNRATTNRSLCQTRNGLEFKGTKTEKPRIIKLLPETIPVLEVHRKRQDAFRLQFGADYQAGDLIFANRTGRH